ncbi:MAG: lysophospholipid acyltransferase family protein [Myxococcota bacterium]
MTREESLWERWSRRAVSFGLYGALWLVALAGFPLWLAGTALWDLLRGDLRFPLARVFLFGVFFLSCEAVGLIGAFLVWAFLGPWTGGAEDRFLAANFRLQCAWANALFTGTRVLFGLELEVTGEEELSGPAPHLWVRHASLADTLLPAVLLGHRHGMRLRWVMKRELLADPCLDVVGQRLPNVFVRRGSSQAELEIAAIARLAETSLPGEGILIYPEGTRFSAERQQRALARVAKSGSPERLERVEKLGHLLPPRLGGPLALLRARPDLDVVIMGHAGLDGLSHVRDVLNGALIGRRISVRYWRHAAADLPDMEAARVDWLDQRWLELDRWLAARLAEDRGDH